MYFWNDLSRFSSNKAIVTDKAIYTYGELEIIADKIAAKIDERSLVFFICSNSLPSLAGYIGCLRKKAVPVMISKSIDINLYKSLFDNYKPQYVWCPKNFIGQDGICEYENYKLISTGYKAVELTENLALMLTTSGSTGSPKFVKQTYDNIQANTESIVDYLKIVSDDVAITTLPMNYTYGLSIIQSHIMAGASIALTELTFFDRGFWQYFRSVGATNFGAVPYTYQMLDKLRFLNMDLPSLRYITQAGGKLGKELHLKYAEGMSKKGKSFIVMYGATEATARMSYVPTEKSVEKAGSIGIAIPGGRFEIIDVNGNCIKQADTVGELIYYGPNVTPGYAQSREDLSKGDERHGRLETGDMAKCDKDGFYYVVGRKKRFLKIFGNRVNLVEIEELLSKHGYESACVGTDDHLIVYTTSYENNEIIDYLSSVTNLNRIAFEVRNIDVIPHNESGKILYSSLSSE